MSPISLVQLAGSVRKLNIDRPFILPLLREVNPLDFGLIWDGVWRFDGPLKPAVAK